MEISAISEKTPLPALLARELFKSFLMGFTADTKLRDRPRLESFNINFFTADFANTKGLVFDFFQGLFDFHD
jgi:hypothetical protein